MPNQMHQINGATFYTYPCKLADHCNRFDSALTFKVVVGVRNHPETNRVVEKLNPCCHGGGVGCPSFRNHLKGLAGGYRKAESVR